MARHIRLEEQLVVPIIMAGGHGKRLWPLSSFECTRSSRTVDGNRSPFLDSVIRLRAWLPGNARPIVVTAQEHYATVKQQLDSIQLEPLAILLEPEPRGTGPALLSAALIADSLKPGAILLAMPCDQVVQDAKRISARIRAAVAAAASGALVTFGLTDAAEDLQASYLVTADSERADGFQKLARFCEDGRPALSDEDPNGVLANSGIYCFTAQSLLDETASTNPELLQGCRQAVAGAQHSGAVYRLGLSTYRKLSAISLGQAVLHYSARALVAPLVMQWEDLGSWENLWALGKRDSHDNLCAGDAHVLESERVYARSEGPHTVVHGIDDVVVVATPDAVLVTRRGDRKGMQKVREHLAQAGRDQLLGDRLRREVWGWVGTIERKPGYALRRIVVHPGCSAPVERHHQRSETLTVVAGVAHLWIDGAFTTLRENDSATIPVRALHGLHNPGRQRLELIELQIGNVTGDADRIVLHDAWRRGCSKASTMSRGFADSEARALLSLGSSRAQPQPANDSADEEAGLGI